MSVVTILNHPVFAAASTTGITDFASKAIGGGIAFGLAAVGAGYAVGRAGSAGLAATAEKNEMRTFALIITSLGEAIAIYGIVIAILILGS
jgi:V/A-type H+-transporting ATPase subunit K